MEGRSVFGARREAKRGARKWSRGHVAWRGYFQQLSSLLKMARKRALALELGNIDDVARLVSDIRSMAFEVDGWTRQAAFLMLADVHWRVRKAWVDVGRTFGVSRRDLDQVPVGLIFMEMAKRQVPLVRNLLLFVADKISQHVTGDVLASGGLRGVLDRCFAMGAARAELIARTEASRAVYELNRVIAENLGSPGYIWRTMRDDRVRDTHQRLEGTFHRWTRPPVTDPPHRSHPGCIWNCRCYAEPVILSGMKRIAA